MSCFSSIFSPPFFVHCPRGGEVPRAWYNQIETPFCLKHAILKYTHWGTVLYFVLFSDYERRKKIVFIRLYHIYAIRNICTGREKCENMEWSTWKIVTCPSLGIELQMEMVGFFFVAHMEFLRLYPTLKNMSLVSKKHMYDVIHGYIKRCLAQSEHNVCLKSQF